VAAFVNPLYKLQPEAPLNGILFKSMRLSGVMR